MITVTTGRQYSWVVGVGWGEVITDSTAGPALADRALADSMEAAVFREDTAEAAGTDKAYSHSLHFI
jgi:hypothetical protein